MGDTQRIAACVLALPEVAAWPEMAGVFERAAGKPRPDWLWPLIACRSVGGDVALAVPSAAAIACMYISIILVDDMLDEDPRGEHLRSGIGPTANMALAFQAAAFGVIERAAVGAERRAAATASLARLALGTALGQYLDAQRPESEEGYWQVVRAKSTPFYGAALHVGALLGSASSEVAEGLHRLGSLLGEVIQIHDDLLDAFQTPANPDWNGQPNLPILYARTADHPDRSRFVTLLAQVDDLQALREAQQILIRCGAVSYCAYHLVKRHRAARQLLADVPLADPLPMVDLLAEQTGPVLQLFQTIGTDLPAELKELFGERST